MNLTMNDHLNQSQPAIDTLCDNCGAIYDLLDCTTGPFGKIFCPECSSQNFLANHKRPKKKLLSYYKILKPFVMKSIFERDVKTKRAK